MDLERLIAYAAKNQLIMKCINKMKYCIALLLQPSLSSFKNQQLFVFSLVLYIFLFLYFTFYIFISHFVFHIGNIQYVCSNLHSLSD